jgi:hypothetical protein
LKTVDDPSKLYSYQNGGNMACQVVPRCGFPASVATASEGDSDINRNARLKDKVKLKNTSVK